MLQLCMNSRSQTSSEPLQVPVASHVLSVSPEALVKPVLHEYSAVERYSTPDGCWTMAFGGFSSTWHITTVCTDTENRINWKALWTPCVNKRIRKATGQLANQSNYVASMFSYILYNYVLNLCSYKHNYTVCATVPYLGICNRDYVVGTMCGSLIRENSHIPVHVGAVPDHIALDWQFLVLPPFRE